MEILLNCMEVLWLCSFSSFRSLSISSLRARFYDSCLLRMLLISAQTCAMKIPTFFLQSRQSSLQLVPSSSVLIDSFRKAVLIVKIQYQNNSITQQVGQHLDIPPKEGLLFLLKKLITIILDCCKSPISMTTQADFAELLNKSEEVNLKLRTRVIELENDLNHEKIRAKEYEDKYRDAMLQSQYSEGQDLLEKLNNKENELNQCRRQIIELNRRLTNTANSPSQSDLIALAQENEELMANIEEIKNAAISAIMVKEEEIEELNKTINRYEVIENQLKFQYEKYESLEREFEIGLKEKQEEIDELNQKIARERENFFNKLEIIQKEATQEESFKQSLLEKAQDLEGNLEKSQMVINEYEHRIAELENTLNQQKIGFEHEKVKINFEIEDLKQNIKSYEKEEKNWNKIFEELKSKQKQSQEQITKLNELNEQLTHKLSIKKKKDNKQIKDKITSSFSGIQKANPVYASFAFRTKDSIYQENEPKHLGGIPEIQDLGGMIENVNFEDMKELPEEKKETPLSKVMSKKKEKTSEVVQAKQENTPVALPSDLAKQIQGYKQSIIRLDAEKKELQISLNDLYGQMQKINESLVSVTNDLQQERKNSAVLREQLKKTKKESQLIVEIQSLNLHVEKLQNDMIASKLKYAQEADFAREKYNREKVIWTQKLVQLTEKIAKQDLQITQKEVKTQEKKKKKGFFG